MMATQSPSGSPSGESLSVRVAREVAAYDDVDPLELSPPLHHSLNTTALDSLFEPTATDGPRRGHVTFVYDGKRITIDSEGEISIESVESEP